MRYSITIFSLLISFSLRSQKDLFSSDLALSCYRFETPKTSICYYDTNMGYLELIIYPNLNLKRINHYYESGIASDWIMYSKDELLYTIHFNDYPMSYMILPMYLRSFINDYPQKGIKNYDSRIRYKEEEEINYVFMLQNLCKKPYPAFENSFCY